MEKGNTSDFPCFPVDGAQAVAVGGECLSVCCRDNEQKTEMAERMLPNMIRIVEV